MDQIELVRSKTDIVALISSYIPIKKAGRNFKALCPFHSEKTPSFIISPERQIFKCFGCQAGGNVFNFLMLYENMEFGEALRFLADKAGVKLTSFQPSKTYAQKEKLMQINHLASEFYHYILTKHEVGKRALNYLLQRGINNSSIKLFMLGYAPENWANLQSFLVGKKGYQLFDLEKAGLIIQSTKSYQPKAVSYYDRFRGRVIFPLFDHRGNVLGFSGRVLTADLKNAKYINSPETILYHKADLLYGLNLTKKEIKEKNQAVVVEGEFDLISSYQAGVKNVVAIKGSALTENQVNLIKRFSDNLALSLDEDAAGEQAAKRGIEIADQAGLNLRVVQLGFGKDPDECARHSPKLWREAIKTAIPVYDFYLKSALKRFGDKGAESKKKISEELTPILSKITNEVVKAYYVKKLARVLSVSEEAVLKEMSRWEKIKEREGTGGIAIKRKTDQSKPASNRRQKLEELLLALILQTKQKSQYLQELDLDHFHLHPIKKILEILVAMPQKDFKINELAKKLPAELIPTLDEAFLLDLQMEVGKEKIFSQAFEQTKGELEKLFLKEQQAVLIAKMKKAEQDKEKINLTSLKVEFKEISQKLKDLV